MSSPEAPRDSESIRRGKHMDCSGLFNNAGSEEGKITAGRELLTAQAWNLQKWMTKHCPPHDPIGKMSSPAQLLSLDPE